LGAEFVWLSADVIGEFAKAGYFIPDTGVG
jgi:hypothetical protein